MAQLWGGRFTKQTDQLVYDFNASITFDQRLYKQDIEGSVAHVVMMAQQGMLTQEEMKQIVEAAGGEVKVIPMLWMVKFPFETVDELCRIYVDLGITSVKTSAGIHFGRMQVEHIEWLCNNWGDQLEIEVAGKVRSREIAERMIEAGARFFHMGSWRRLGGIGQDIQFDFNTKETKYGEYKEAE